MRCWSSLPVLVAVGALALLTIFAVPAQGATKAQWKSRTIYQVLTDRFARTTDTTAGCSNLNLYCGGTWKGIQNHLDYIAGMGYDAIWISPIVANTAGGYHGYWTQNFNSLNSNFGTAADLNSLIQAVHNRGMYIMVDVVANHVGPPPNGNPNDFSGITPYNQAAHYHSCASCPNPDTSNARYCWIDDSAAIGSTQMTQCRESGLPDLNHENTDVSSSLLSWISTLVSTYNFDGIRVDSVPEMTKSFSGSFQQSAGVFAMGEILYGNTAVVGGYQSAASCLQGVLDYPMYYQLINAFASGMDITSTLAYQLGDNKNKYEDVDAVGGFLENHDQSRFFSLTTSTNLYKSAIITAFYTPGIPIGYYGGEQQFYGDHNNNSNNNREVLWTTGFSTSNGKLYSFFSTIIKYRKAAAVYSSPLIIQVCNPQLLTFSRGTTFVAVTNSANNLVTPIPANQSPFPANTQICNILASGDCLTTGSDKSWTLYQNGGEPKIWDTAVRVRHFIPSY